MKKVRSRIYVYICIGNLFVALLLMSSCSTFKEVGRDMVVESITDPKTGTPVFTREYDTKPYQINADGIIKARKAQKRKKRREVIENYDMKQNQ